MEKLEIRVVIKYCCKKGLPPNEIREDFMETLGQQSLRGGERALGMMDRMAD